MGVTTADETLPKTKCAPDLQTCIDICVLASAGGDEDTFCEYYPFAEEAKLVNCTGFAWKVVAYSNGTSIVCDGKKRKGGNTNGGNNRRTSRPSRG
jgi:hypothetical protein